MKNYAEAETPKLIEMSSPQGIIVPDIGVIAYKVEILLNASQLKLVKSALEHGKRLIQIRLARTKKPRKRCTTEIEGNVISSVMEKTELCKCVQRYPLEVLDVELEAIIYCLEHSQNSKSKDVQQLINALSAYFDYEE